MTEGWVLVLVAAISGGVGLTGTLLGNWQTNRARQREREDEHARQHHTAKTAAYLQMLQAVHRVESAADRAMLAGGREISSDELVRDIIEAEIAVRMYAPPDVWARIEPSVRAVSLKANALIPGQADRALDELRSLGADNADVVEQLHEQALAAIRNDLNRTPGR